MSNGGFLLDAGPTGTLLALLLAGHVLGDFLFQTRRMVERKGESLAWLAAHAAVVTLVHALVLLPIFAGRGLVLVLALGAGHLVLDRAKARLGDARAVWFLCDQALHLALVFLVWRLWAAWVGVEPILPYSQGELDTVTIAAVLVAAYAFNVNGGATIVAMVVRSRPTTTGGEPAVDNRELAGGRVIGILERMLVLTLVLIDQWGALGLVFAAKSIARFRELEDRAFGEYYLVGTLSSLLVAIATGLLVTLLI